jgi:hypothetical protein
VWKSIRAQQITDSVCQGQAGQHDSTNGPTLALPARLTEVTVRSTILAVSRLIGTAGSKSDWNALLRAETAMCTPAVEMTHACAGSHFVAARRLCSDFEPAVRAPHD